MFKPHCLGLIGGLGVGAATHYYSKLASAHEQQGLTLDLVMVHADLPRVFACVEAGDRLALAHYLNSFIFRLQAAGADAIAIPALTPHFCIRELLAASPLPLFNIFDPLIHELAVRGLQRVAVFGTRFVMDSSLFGLLPGVQIVPSRPDEAAVIHSTYLELIRHGKASEEHFRLLTALAQTLCRRDQVDAIVLAGTDLSLLFNEANTDFPHIDCTALHLQAIMKGLTGELPPPLPTHHNTSGAIRTSCTPTRGARNP